jgi:hypothetical protein
MQTRDRRRPPRTQTDRQDGADACVAHLRDLKRAHGRPPADIELTSLSVPLRPALAPVASYCTSAGELCAELMR